MNKGITALMSLFLLLSCNSTKKSNSGPDIPRNSEQITVEVITYNHQRPIEGVTVTFNFNQVCVTDKSGKCNLIVLSKQIGNTGDFSIFKESISLEESYNVRVTRRTVLTPDLLIGEKKVIEPRADENVNQLKEFDKEILIVEDLLSSLEARIKSYILKNGDSALEEYIPQLDESKRALIRLKDEITSLSSRYSTLLSRFTDNEIVDIQQFEPSFNTLSRRVSEYTLRVSDVADAVDQNIKVDPNINVQYLYDTGEFIPIEDTESIERQLQSYSDKINQYINTHYSYTDRSNINVVLYFYGYTDGQNIPVSSDTYDKVVTECNKLNFVLTTDPNDCLSFLRAYYVKDKFESISNIIADKIKVEGLGDKLANGSDRKNDSIRKCVLSFAIFEK